MNILRAAAASAVLAFSLTAARAQQTPSPEVEGQYRDLADPDNLVSYYLQNGVLVSESLHRIPAAFHTLSPTEFEQEKPKAALRFAKTGKDEELTITEAGSGETTRLIRIGKPVKLVFPDYKRTEAMIPARDGVKLHVVILKPADAQKPLPFLITRTPYGCDGTTKESFFASRPELAHAGYIWVCADIRGKYGSEGEFTMNHPMEDHSKPGVTDEGTDAWDTVDWLLKNVPGNNGRAGFIGTSYPGFTAMAAGIDPHPAVKAISPQAPMIDAWIGDDFFHNGAFRQSYGYDYIYRMERSKEQTPGNYGKEPDGKDVDGYDYFLRRGSFEEDVKQSGAGLLPSWKHFLEHPSYDEVWRSHGLEWWLNKVTVPTLTVGGYYDQEDMWGSQEEYARLEKHDTKAQNFQVLGPWRHGSWASDLRHLGAVQYGRSISRDFRANIEEKFFAFYLKDEPGFDLKDTASFQTGSNVWKYYDQFPPANAKSTPLYLRAEGKLAWTAPGAAEKTSYVSDPSNPVPYRHRPIQPTYNQGSQWYNWLTEDQRFVADRKDVAIWRMPVTTDLTLTGEVLADLFASTTGTDGDFVVKLIDEYPADDPDPAMRGYQLMTNAEIFRARYLKGFDKPEPLAAGKIHEIKFSLHDVDHVFKAGHTLIVEVQSTWFPLYDRNPQTFVPNIMTARPADYKAQTITVYSGPRHESSLLVPVVAGN